MKIDITPAGGKHFRILLPTRLVLNPVTALLLPRYLKKQAGHKVLTVRQCLKLFRAVFKARKYLGASWELVNVMAHDGTRVIVHP